ncbi:MAG: hypothetical protein JSV03_03765 [Planctomycetota bacterium]|nr:MAG: hypothetical protein JSV03_03765 [Planctomycetota bacterium]
MKRIAWSFMVVGLVVGCGGNARLEMAASDTLRALADQVAVAIDEYHREVSNLDDTRESAVVSAFVARIKNDVDDESAVESHVTDFKSALGKIRTDRETEWLRQSASMENVKTLREVAAGLQKMAIDSLTLQDEMRRYLTGWIEARRQANKAMNSKGE